MTNHNHFELFEDEPGFEEADAALHAALKHAATLPDWNTARRYMETVQDKYDYLGAHDSEPRNHIVTALNNLFPNDARDWWGNKLKDGEGVLAIWATNHEPPKS